MARNADDGRPRRQGSRTSSQGRQQQNADKEPAKPSSLAAQAYEEIKEKILTLYFLPGQYLNEGALSRLLDVGRTPVHQALQRLELEGLVEIMPRKGVIVLPDSITEIIKILEFARDRGSRARRNAAAGRVPARGRQGAARARQRHQEHQERPAAWTLHRRRPRLPPQTRRACGKPGAERFRPHAARALDPLLVSAPVADHGRAGDDPPARRHRRRHRQARRRARGRKPCATTSRASRQA